MDSEIFEVDVWLREVVMHVECVTEGVPDHAGDEEAVVLGHPVCEVDTVVLEETLAQRVGDLLSVVDCVTLVLSDVL